MNRAIPGIASRIRHHGAEQIGAIAEVALGRSGGGPGAAAIGRHLISHGCATVLAREGKIKALVSGDEIAAAAAAVAVIGEAEGAGGERCVNRDRVVGRSC